MYLRKIQRRELKLTLVKRMGHHFHQTGPPSMEETWQLKGSRKRTEACINARLVTRRPRLVQTRNLSSWIARLEHHTIWARTVAETLWLCDGCQASWCRRWSTPFGRYTRELEIRDSGSPARTITGTDQPTLPNGERWKSCHEKLPRLPSATWVRVENTNSWY